MEDSLGSFGDFLGKAGGAFATVYSQIKPDDKKQLAKEEAWNWKPFAIAGGVALAVAVVLRVALK
jgi:hypothetical protein